MRVAKKKFQSLQNDNQMFPQIYAQCIHPLQMDFQAGLFHEDSLLVKSLRNTLTAEQFARYAAMAREHRATRHRASVLTAAVRLEQAIVLRDAQRRELVALLTNETKPTLRSSPYDADVVLLQLDRLPREKLKRLFDKKQWERVNEQLDRCHHLEPMLKRAGLLPAEGDGADSTAK
jgi:hypothetical protein